MNVIKITLNNLFPLITHIPIKENSSRAQQASLVAKPPLTSSLFWLICWLREKGNLCFFCRFLLSFFCFFIYINIISYYLGTSKNPHFMRFQTCFIGSNTSFIGTIRTRLIDIMVFSNNQKSIKLGCFSALRILYIL